MRWYSGSQFVTGGRRHPVADPARLRDSPQSYTEPIGRAGVAEVLKPALKEIWRHNGHRGMPIFDGNNVRMEA